MAHANQEKPELRLAFVEMLFALAVAEIALKAAEIHTWQKAWDWYLPSYSHLVLGSALIMCSWVGWQQSPASKNRFEPGSVFSWGFVVLSLDVILVVLYFFVVRSVDAEVRQETSPVTSTYQVSALPEAWLMVVIFGVYMIWDVVTKWIDPKDGSWKKLLVRGHATAVSLCCSILILLLARKRGAQSSSDFVLSVDLALISLVFLFRALKPKGSLRWRIISGVAFAGGWLGAQML